METGSERTSPSTCGPRRVVRQLTSEQRVLALDVPAELVGDVSALVDDTASVVHASPEQIPAMQERFAVGVAHLGGSVQSLRPVVDVLRLALVPDGVAVVVWDPSAVSADTFTDVVGVVQDAFAISYVLADRTLWISQAAPSLPELTDVDGRLFMAIASDAAWRLRAVTETGTPAEELKPIFRLVKEQAIHLDDQRSLLADFEQRLGVQSQQLDRTASSVQELHEDLAEARADRQAAASAKAALTAEVKLWEERHAALTAEVKLWEERYAAVVGSAAWRLAERLRKLRRPLRRSARH